MLGHLEILSHLSIYAGFKQLLLNYVNISFQVKESDRNVIVFESEKRTMGSYCALLNVLNKDIDWTELRSQNKRLMVELRVISEVI